MAKELRLEEISLVCSGRTRMERKELCEHSTDVVFLISVSRCQRELVSFHHRSSAADHSPGTPLRHPGFPRRGAGLGSRMWWGACGLGCRVVTMVARRRRSAVGLSEIREMRYARGSGQAVISNAPHSIDSGWVEAPSPP